MKKEMTMEMLENVSGGIGFSMNSEMANTGIFPKNYTPSSPVVRIRDDDENLHHIAGLGDDNLHHMSGRGDDENLHHRCFC